MENKLFSEITIGQSASITKILTKSEIELFAVVTGNANPIHLNAELAEKHLHSSKVIGHGAWLVCLASNVLGNELPGPGTVYKKQAGTFHRSVEVGDTVHLTLTVKEKIDASSEVIFEVIATNQKGEMVYSGTSQVEAPLEKIDIPRIQLPTALLRREVDVFHKIISKCDSLEPINFAICYPCDANSLKGPMDAAECGLIAPLLIGPQKKIEQIARDNQIDLSKAKIMNTESAEESAQLAVSLCLKGDAEVLMKGSLHTDTLMHAVVDRTHGLRTGRKISHTYVMSVPTYPRLLFITDAAINIYPTLEDKVDIIQNSIDLAHIVGIPNPKVAILSAIEVINPKIQSTLDAASLCKMADRGQIQGGVIDGPLAFDNAVSPEAALIKKISSPVAGQADILVAPDLEAGNMIAKQLDYLAGASAAGIVLGAKVPIVLTSRAESPKARKTSAALAVLVAHAQRKKRL